MCAIFIFLFFPPLNASCLLLCRPSCMPVIFSYSYIIIFTLVIIFSFLSGSKFDTSDLFLFCFFSQALILVILFSCLFLFCFILLFVGATALLIRIQLFRKALWLFLFTNLLSRQYAPPTILPPSSNLQLSPSPILLTSLLTTMLFAPSSSTSPRTSFSSTCLNPAPSTNPYIPNLLL